MKNYPEKLIFLDLDHVLTNTDLDQSSFLSYDPSKYHLSLINLKFLDNILAKTDAKIVVASNWRRFVPPYIIWEYKGKQYKSIFEPFKKIYKDYIIGILPPDRHITKCEALELWFEDNEWFNKKSSRYVILEDDTREGYQAHPIFLKHLILTDYHVGLTEKDANKAISILL